MFRVHPAAIGLSCGGRVLDRHVAHSSVDGQIPPVHLSHQALVVRIGSIGKGFASFGIRIRRPRLPWPGFSPSFLSLQKTPIFLALKSHFIGLYRRTSANSHERVKWTTLRKPSKHATPSFSANARAMVFTVGEHYKSNSSSSLPIGCRRRGPASFGI